MKQVNKNTKPVDITSEDANKMSNMKPTDKSTMQKRSTIQAINDAIVRLHPVKGDSEAYHSVFDDLLEERLMELDPEYMKELQRIYNQSGESRWCA